MWTATIKELNNLIYGYGQIKESLTMTKTRINEAIRMIQDEEYEKATETLVQLLGEM